MKIIKAEFLNFRLLRNLELNFSTDSERRLTVIRAANETGKTTILTALQWGFYGDAALPAKGEDYRLHPIDWLVNEGKRVEVTVTIDFEVTRFRRSTSGPVESKRQYRIVRSAQEELDGTVWRRLSTSVKLFVITDRGADPIDSPETFIKEELPPELREVFFTDGDRALSFIEADVAVSTKRDRVERAIRSLLGLGILEDAIKHIQKAASDVNRQVKQNGSGSELVQTASRLDEIDGEITKKEQAIEDAGQQFSSFDSQLADIDHKISEALQRGDKEKLKRDLEIARREVSQLEERSSMAAKDHSALFKSEALARDVLGSGLADAFDLLKGLRDRGKIPNTTIPVLEDRLAAEECICGENLREDNSEGAKRRQHISRLIESSRKADQLQEIMTDLYYGAQAFRGGEIGSASWLQNYQKVAKNRDELQHSRDTAGRKLKSIELQIDSLPNTDIQGLRETRRDYAAQRDRFLKKKTTLETELSALKRESENLSRRRDVLLRDQKKGALALAQFHVTKDIQTVFERSLQRITNEELVKVGELMNSIFLEMIGADPKQGAIIQKATVSKDFDIIVYGPNGRTLNPDRDLNGASRRALTLSFILALTKVSEVEAPNVIDTPLGMMSGYVKRSVLRKAIKQSTQIILFLTHSEIQGCEKIIDDSAGVVITLTNPAHFPLMLVNDPGVRERRVLACKCNHRQSCKLCERRLDLNTNQVEDVE